MIVTVIGASGKTGGVVAERLLAQGVEVRAFARSKEKLAPLATAGAQVFAGDVLQAADLTAVLRGSDAAYLLIPPNYGSPDPIAYYDAVSEALATALTESGVRRVVFLSSLGAELPSGTGIVVGLHRAEERLKKLSGLDLLFLRPGYFYENFYGSLGMIKGMGVNGGATLPDVPVTMIASRDIGVVAADALVRQDFTGTSVRELVGPRPLTMAEATRLLGEKIGKPDLKYQQFPDDGVIGGLQQAGFSPAVARSFVEMSHGFNEGRFRTSQERSAGTTGTTTFEGFAEAFAQAYHA